MRVYVNTDFETQRTNMVESQVRTSDVSDALLISAIATTPRENLCVENQIQFAYSEVYIKTKSGRTLMKPRVFAKLAQEIGITKSDAVLIIAGAGGYSATIFAKLSKGVTNFDEAEFAAKAEGVVSGDIKTLSQLSGQKFDAIFVDQGVEEVPSEWFDALNDGGRLAVVKYDGEIGNAVIFNKANGHISSKIAFDANAPRLLAFNKAKEFEF